MAEKRAAKLEEKARDLEVAHIMAEKARREEEVEKERDLIRFMTVKKYHAELDQQLEVFRFCFC